MHEKKEKQRIEKEPFFFLLYNLIMDRILCRVSWAFAPLYWLNRLFTLSGMLFRLCINEYQKRIFASCGTGVRLHGKVTVTGKDRLTIGKNVHINSNAYIRAEGGVSIGDNVHISRNLVLYSMSHEYEADYLPYNHEKRLRETRIGRNAWIGMNVVISPGADIGEGAIIGIGSVVSGDVPPMAIVGAVPPAVLKSRDKEKYDVADGNNAYSGVNGYPNSFLNEE